MQNRLEMLRIFCAAVDAGSFKAAAIRLGISPQAVTRAVQDTESTVGDVLFHRNTRQVRATDAGERFAVRARVLVSQMDALLRPEEHQEEADLSGIVRITAPGSIAAMFLTPVLAQLSRTHPRLTIDMRLSDAIVDPVADQIDIGVRIGFMRDSRFVARRVNEVSFCVVASPALLKRIKPPLTLDDLDRVPTTGFLDSNTGRIWPWQFSHDRQVSPSNLVLHTDDADVECRAVLAGMGVGQLVSYLAQPYVRAGKLLLLLEPFAPEPWPVYVYRPQRGPVPMRVRKVFDDIVNALSAADLRQTIAER